MSRSQEDLVVEFAAVLAAFKALAPSMRLGQLIVDALAHDETLDLDTVSDADLIETLRVHWETGRLEYRPPVKRRAP